MDNEAAIAYAKLAINSIAFGQKAIDTKLALETIEAEMLQLMDLYTEQEAIKKAAEL